MPAEGFMRPPKGLDADSQLEVELFAEAVGIGPLFNQRPRHRGQHSWCCRECNTFRAESETKTRDVRQPWQPKLVNPDDPVEYIRHHDIAYWRGKSGKVGWVDEFVYFIQAFNRPTDPMKIGVAKDPERRLATLQTAHPYRLTIVRAVPGDRRLERCIHEVFKDHRVQGEWFAGPGVPVVGRFSRILSEWFAIQAGHTGRLPDLPDLHALSLMASQARREFAAEQLAA